MGSTSKACTFVKMFVCLRNVAFVLNVFRMYVFCCSFHCTTEFKAHVSFNILLSYSPHGLNLKMGNAKLGRIQNKKS
jgi:hypothetical protein